MSDTIKNLLSTYYGFGRQVEAGKTLSTHDSVKILNDEASISLFDESSENEEQILIKEESKEDTAELCEEGFSTLDEKSSICDEEVFDDEEFSVEYEDIVKKICDENYSETLETDSYSPKSNFKKLNEENVDVENLENLKIYPENLIENTDFDKTLSSCRKFSSIDQYPCDGIFFNLTGVGISCLPKNIFTHFPNLKMLYLDGNKLDQLPDELFINLKSLQWLDVRNNEITFFPLSITGHLNLETILIQKNRVERLPLELGTLLKLKNLQTAYNPLLYPPKEILNLGSSEVLRFLREEWNKTYPNELVEIEAGEIFPKPSTILCYQPKKNNKKALRGKIKKFQSTNKATEKSLVRRKTWNYKPSNRCNISMLTSNNKELNNLCENCASLNLKDQIKSSNSHKVVSLKKSTSKSFNDKIKTKNLQSFDISDNMLTQLGPIQRSRYVKNNVSNLISHKENSTKICQLDSLKIDLIRRAYNKKRIKSLIANKVGKKEFDVITRDASIKKLNPLQLKDPKCDNEPDKTSETQLLWIEKAKEFLDKRSSELQKLIDKNTLQNWRYDRSSYNKSMRKAANRTEEEIPFAVDSSTISPSTKRSQNKDSKQKISPTKNAFLENPITDINKNIDHIFESLNQLKLTTITENSNNSCDKKLLEAEMQKVVDLQNSIKHLKKHNDIITTPFCDNKSNQILYNYSQNNIIN